MRAKLTGPLVTIFRANRPVTEHLQATNILSDYARDNPTLVADLLLDADPTAYAAFFSIAQREASTTLPLFQKELATKATHSWNDHALNSAWTKPDAALESRIESAQGMLLERFAFCQTMLMDEFLTTAETLRESGYRPVRFRPYSDGQVVRVAAVWTRDGRPWRLAVGLSAEQLRAQDDELQRANVGRGSPDPAHRVDRRSPNADAAPDQGRPSVPDRAGSGDPRPTGGDPRPTGGDPRPTGGDPRPTPSFIPVDVAGYVTTDTAGAPGDRYVALWVEKTRDDVARLYVGAAADEETDIQNTLNDEKLIPRTLHAMVGVDGRTRHCGVWGRPPAVATIGQTVGGQFEGNFEQNQVDRADQLLIDIAVSGASKTQTTRDRARTALLRAERKLKTGFADHDSGLAQALAHLRLEENQKALNELQAFIGLYPGDTSAKEYRVIALARLGNKEDARSELARLQEEDGTESSKLYLAAVVAAELGEGASQAFEALEAAIKKQPEDAGLRYDAARAYSLASRATARIDRARARQLAERCLQLLKESVNNDDADFGKMDEDSDLGPIRDDPAFAEIMRAGHPDRRYGAVWRSDARFEGVPIRGLDPTAHLEKCRTLIAQGYRPVSWSVCRTAPEEPMRTASVWHRPVISEELKDRLAERQARAAVALARMGQAEKIWPLLRHSADPRLRSFIVNWLNPMRADPKLIAGELDRLDSRPRPAERGEASRGPGEGSSTSGAGGRLANLSDGARKGRLHPRWRASSSTPRPRSVAL